MWNDPDSGVFPVLVSPSTVQPHVLSLLFLLCPWSEVSVAQHTLLSPDVYSIRTGDIFALEELSFNEMRREQTPIFVDARHLLIL